jgi:hypothetical protein
MRGLGAEVLIAVTVCIAGGVGISIWRSHPVIATALIATLAAAAARVGYRVETVLHPDSRVRRFILIPVVYGALAIIGAVLLWATYCPCSSN